MPTNKADKRDRKKATKRANELRATLTELAAEHESREAEMESLQAELEHLEAQSTDDTDDRDDNESADDAAPFTPPPSPAERLAAAEENYRRVLADFQNYQRRAIDNERRARDAGRAGVLEAMADILDTFELAAQMNPETTTPHAMLQGLDMIKGELIRKLSAHGFSTITPPTNAEFDPHRHEAVQQSDDPDITPGHVAKCIKAGYALEDRVLRPARVAVKPAPDTPSTTDDQTPENPAPDDNDTPHNDDTPPRTDTTA